MSYGSTSICFAEVKLDVSFMVTMHFQVPLDVFFFDKLAVM